MDTVILTFPRHKFEIKDLSYFGTTRDLATNDPRGFAPYYNNPTPQEKREGIYMPVFSLYRRGRVWWLNVQFSVQKLLFGNSADEAEETDFEPSIKKLQECLQRRSIQIEDQDIRDASPIAIHPAKNIIIGDGYRSIFVVSELSKVNLTEKLEMDRKQYKNNGHALQYYSKAHALVIYDKKADNRKSTSRAIEEDRMPQQLSLFKELNKKHLLPEILRIEVRLCDKTKMNQVLKKLGYSINPTFKDVFKKDLWQKVVQMYWQHFVAEKNLFLYDMTSGPQASIRKIIRNNTTIKPKQAIYQAGILALARDQEGIRGMRKELSAICDRRTWYRIADDFKPLNKSQKIIDCHSWVRDIENQLRDFKSYKLPKFDV
ncbi:MAG: hypothetical protein A3B86_02195 [Candidatus Yanofskybacteria bacterium RIFCSPHIGHO2_02_FULL_38_22b]|uniref:Uncharacterized protein n=1 Tax=Candidatus Yanofskybacteria bacterium RIFCSPHIGHO2_02_FULL_38_22b TaxID=1802673 RepID=A0A1F8F4N6_9BACT|nr:MAG: hypothetical protein A3B86_02195 [Candidatus Yanofskybacteria bacterium RIFCSPHIGHO2_02_FULL_38_22b]OGN20260.1 MAG: hypothetical protein A2910_03030 [Candidatus Yanofskybacteria bacterium RIFCSPLOWO2_01_FULL_39_28]